MNQSAANTWWSRNGRWFVPAVVFASVLFVAAFITAIFFFVFGLMKSSDAYQQALARARASPAVVAALGTPIAEGYFTTGSIKTSGPSGSAQLAIPISGPNGAGTIFLEARKSLGEWSFSKLVFEIDKSKKRIDLLSQAQTPINRLASTGNEASDSSTVVTSRDPADPADFLMNRKLQTPVMTDLLAEVGKWMSDDVTLEQLNVDDKDKLELQGLASDTAIFLGRLQKSELLSSPTVQGMPQVDPLTKKQLFKIVAELSRQADRVLSKGGHALIAAADFNDAFSELTQRLKQVMSVRVDKERPCSIVSHSDVRDGKEEEAYTRATIQVHMRCDLDTFKAIVSDLETGSPDLFVRQMTLLRQHGGYVPPGASAPSQPALDIRFNLSGYLRQPEDQR